MHAPSPHLPPPTPPNPPADPGCMRRAGTRLPLIHAARASQVVALVDRAGAAEPHRVTARVFLDDVRAMADHLPEGHHVLNWCTDRYRFAVTLSACIVRGRISLLPSNHTPGLTQQLLADHPDLHVIADGPAVDADLPVVPYPLPMPGTGSGAAADEVSDEGAAVDVPMVDVRQVIAHVFTSGSTGLPLPHAKHFGSLVCNVRSEARRLGLRPDSDTTLIGTVPPQHMYGFESTVLMALHNGIAMHAGRPFYPADIAMALARTTGTRVLVTTPFHLRTLLGAGIDVPSPELIVSATAPLPIELAHEAERVLRAPLLEIYGCTEAGQVATRRPVDGATWTTFRDVTVRRQDGQWFVEGGHVDQPTALSDVLELDSPTRFRLVGRHADMVNIAGKRTSIAYLTALLNRIPGVRDGVYLNPQEAVDAGASGTSASGRDAAGIDVQRLVAFYVSDTLDTDAVMQALRAQIDPVFLPRPLVRVAALPRADSGKLTRAALLELARQAVPSRSRQANP